jgi:hypothetical protein
VKKSFSCWHKTDTFIVTGGDGRLRNATTWSLNPKLASFLKSCHEATSAMTFSSDGIQ